MELNSKSAPKQVGRSAPLNFEYTMEDFLLDCFSRLRSETTVRGIDIVKVMSKFCSVILYFLSVRISQSVFNYYLHELFWGIDFILILDTNAEGLWERYRC